MYSDKDANGQRQGKGQKRLRAWTGIQSQKWARIKKTYKKIIAFEALNLKIYKIEF